MIISRLFQVLQTEIRRDLSVSYETKILGRGFIKEPVRNPWFYG